MPLQLATPGICYLFGWKVKTFGGRQMPGGEKGEKVYITVCIILGEKKRGKRVYFHILKKWCHFWTHSTECMKIASKLNKPLSSHSRDVF